MIYSSFPSSHGEYPTNGDHTTQLLEDQIFLKLHITYVFLMDLFEHTSTPFFI